VWVCVGVCVCVCVFYSFLSSTTSFILCVYRSCFQTDGLEWHHAAYLAASVPTVSLTHAPLAWAADYHALANALTRLGARAPAPMALPGNAAALAPLVAAWSSRQAEAPAHLVDGWAAQNMVPSMTNDAAMSSHPGVNATSAGSKRNGASSKFWGLALGVGAMVATAVVFLWPRAKRVAGPGVSISKD
jgi:hypothetical protein